MNREAPFDVIKQDKIVEEDITRWKSLFDCQITTKEELILADKKYKCMCDAVIEYSKKPYNDRINLQNRNRGNIIQILIEIANENFRSSSMQQR